MSVMPVEQEAEVRRLEQLGDELVQKGTFDACLSA